MTENEKKIAKIFSFIAFLGGNIEILSDVWQNSPEIRVKSLNTVAITHRS